MPQSVDIYEIYYSMKKILFSAIVLAALSASCSHKVDNGVRLLDESAFCTELDGRDVALYTLRNSNGMTVQITNYGARVVSLWVPASDGRFRDVVWGLPDIDSYLNAKDIYAGPVVGRYGNRIGGGRFELDGKVYQLSVNEHGNQLHGGAGGFSTRVWEGRTAVSEDGCESLELSYFSPDGEEGYPGNLKISVTYSLTADNGLKIGYEATTDAPTVLNPTSHVYFNLHGTSSRSTDSHFLTIYADSITLTDSQLIPTGEMLAVDGTPMDFRKAMPIGPGMDRKDFEPVRIGGGYDHNWVLEKGMAYGKAAELYEPSTGICMEIFTDQPGLQFYGGQGMNGKDIGKWGESHDRRTGVALETQNFPDAPNHDNFPDAVLRPGEKYVHNTEYRFSVK